MDYASKGVAGTGLGLGIAGTALGVLDMIGAGAGLLRRPQSDGDKPVTRFEMGLYQQINAKDNEITGLRSAQYTDRAIQGVQAQISAQMAYNATMNANIGCIQNQISQLQGMTKLVVPNDSVSPGWGHVAIEPVFAVEAAKLAQTANTSTTGA